MLPPATEKDLARSDRRFEPARMRRTVLEMAWAGSAVHIASAFSIVELLTTLYRSHLRYPDNDPRSPTRDFLVLSKGHGVMAQYACLRELGWLDETHIRAYFSDGSLLLGLSDSRLPGLEVSSGSLGHGFSVGVGIAMGVQRKRTDQRVYAIVGDGELDEGSIWEGVMVAAHHRMDKLMLIVDQNGFQAMGRTEEVLALGDLEARFATFGFETLAVDGHDEAAIDRAIGQLWATGDGKPKALVARTIKGKGVPFMESDNRWHYQRLNADTYAAALAALGFGGPGIAAGVVTR